MITMKRTEGTAAKIEAREQLKRQIAQHVEQQPASRKVFHQWMQGLEVASLVFVAAVFVLALYVSINWTDVPVKAIPAAWLALPGSFSLTLILLGLHSIILKAFPTGSWMLDVAMQTALPFVPTQKNEPFISGREAAGRGWAFVLMGFLLGGFWGLFVYATWTTNWSLLKPLITILSVAFSAGLIFGLILTTVRKLSKSH